MREFDTLDQWRGEVTFLASKFNPRPSRELDGLTWVDLIDEVAPLGGPQVVLDKGQVAYLLPCPLREALYVGQTAARMAEHGRTHGKQRSKSHVTQAAWIVFDLDSVPQATLDGGLARLKAAGLTFLAYTTWSLGSNEKPGICARCVLPLDRRVGADHYRVLWRAFDTQFFQGKADESSGNLWQQQGVWACPPDRRGLAKRWLHHAGLVDVGSMLAGVPATPACELLPKSSSRVPPDALVEQVNAARAAIGGAWSLDPSGVLRWAGAPDRVLDGQGREVAVLRLAGKLHAIGLPHEFIEQVCLEFNRRAIEPPLDEAVALDRARRNAGSEVLWAMLFGAARDVGLAVIADARRTDQWHGTREIWTYVQRHHPAAWRAAWVREGTAI